LSSSKTEIESLLEGLQKTDPRLYTILRLLSDNVDEVYNTLIPASIQSAIAQATAKAPLAVAVDTFTYSLQPRSVRFNWATDDINTVEFEVRQGAVWETAFFQFRTSATQADINPINVGTTHYLIKAINPDGVYSVDSLGLDVVIPSIGNVSLTAEVIDNNVNLRWTIPTSTWTIDYYIVKSGVGTPTERARISGNFISLFEKVSGLYTYSITPVDVAGDVGPEISVTTTVDQPPDFSLTSSITSNFSGTKNNCILQGANGRLLACTDLIKTWTTHFTTPGWTDIQDQVTAGFNVYALPAVLTGYYEEVIDYGAAFNNIIVNLDWSTNIIIGSVAVSSQISASLDNITYSAPVAGPSAYYTSARYVKIRIIFTPANTGSLIEFYNLRILLDVKREIDSGEVNAVNTDVGGTTVTFNKSFKDIDSITTSVHALEPITVNIDFVDIPNPVSFKVLCFDSAGVRISQLVSWKARGIV
jgi:hypothetical protein